MQSSKADIISRLQKEILPLQGFKTGAPHSCKDIGLGPIKYAFPGNVFPQGAIHEFIVPGQIEIAPTCGFISALLSSFKNCKGITLWISASRQLFPPALKFFGIDPDNVFFIDLANEKEVLWTLEEALKCEGLLAVIGETKDLDFTSSRRLQLAVETSGVTGFIIRKNTKTLTTTACIARWRICSSASELPGDMPGVGFPAWHIELLKVRNGKPGSWYYEWKNGKLEHLSRIDDPVEHLQKKTG